MLVQYLQHCQAPRIQHHQGFAIVEDTAWFASVFKQTFVVQEADRESEEAALKETIAAEGAEASGKWKRRLLNFALVNAQDDCVSVQKVGLEDCEPCFLNGAALVHFMSSTRCTVLALATVSEIVWQGCQLLACVLLELHLAWPFDQGLLVCVGAIYPANGPLSKDLGRNLTKHFGPVASWSACYTGSEPAICIATAAAEYTVSKPTADFRALFTDAQDQVQLCHSIVQAIKGKDGSTMSFEAVLAAVNRAKAVKGYVSVRDAVLLSGPFILSQAAAMQAAVGNDFVLADSSFFKGLKEEVCHCMRTKAIANACWLIPAALLAWCTQNYSHVSAPATIGLQG
jgi:Cytosine specific DNA methyltransferase replication foci domain